MREKYKVTLRTSEKEYKEEGSSVLSCLEKIGLKWNQIKAKGTIIIERKGNTYEHLFQLQQLKRIFANKLTRMMWSKRLELLLKSKINE